MSLGLNILPTVIKLCNFNCVYCQYGWTGAFRTKDLQNNANFPTPESFESALEKALRTNEVIDNITFSGNGEATLHPDFETLVDIALSLKKIYFPRANLGILSNSTNVMNPKIAQALSKLDFRLMKLDAGDPETFRSINQPAAGVDFQEIVRGLKQIKNITIQSMFVRGKKQNIGENQVHDWIELIKEIKPIRVQVYSLDRPPADEDLETVSEEQLKLIAFQLNRVSGIAVDAISPGLHSSISTIPYKRTPEPRMR